MAQQITYDKAYDAVAPEDFPAMLEVPRYGRRSDAFDSIISATHDHFWDPLDKNYIDFDQPFDMATTSVVPLDEAGTQASVMVVLDNSGDVGNGPVQIAKDQLAQLEPGTSGIGSLGVVTIGGTA